MGASLSLDYISHRFTRQGPVILKGIEQHIAPGELVALIGRSGCGKSTLLHMLAGLLEPSEGCVRINGHQVTGPSAKWNMMFQKPSLYPWMSVEENAALGLMFAGMPKKLAVGQVAELLDMVGLAEHRRDNVQRLSGGQQQRVALARSLATAPDILLLDEPFSALDAFARTALQQEVPGICRERGITLVMVTHDIDEAITMADRVLIMSRNPGAIVDEVTVSLDWPRRHMAAGFQSLRAQLMNAFRDTTDGASEGTNNEVPTGARSEHVA